MADLKISALDETSVPAFDDLLAGVDVSDTTMAGSGTTKKLTLQRLFGQLFPQVAGGRLTTESGVPVSTSDRTSQGTLYYTPFAHNRISLYDGTRWRLYTFTERSLSLTLTSGKNYDVFLYDNSGTLTLELSADWTNDSTRADALTTQDGVFVKSGAPTRRWLGTIRASGTNVVEDSLAKRFVWNAQNQVARPLQRVESTASWTYTTATWRQANASTANQLSFVCGAPVMFTAQVGAYRSNSSGNVGMGVAVGLDSTTSPTGIISRAGSGSAANENNFTSSALSGVVAAGYHYLAWLEISFASGTSTWLGVLTDILQSGISGHIDGN